MKAISAGDIATMDAFFTSNADRAQPQRGESPSVVLHGIQFCDSLPIVYESPSSHTRQQWTSNEGTSTGSRDCFVDKGYVVGEIVIIRDETCFESLEAVEEVYRPLIDYMMIRYDNWNITITSKVLAPC